jgi:hypothetical protein
MRQAMTANFSDPASAIAPLVALPHRRHVSVDSITFLNDFWEQAGPGRSLAVSSRHEFRNGQYWGLGGLDWAVVTAGLVVTATTGEDEELPDLPVVRAGWPYAFADELIGVAA